MNSERDLALLADGIARLEDELAEATATKDRTELDALLELARETYAIAKARLENATSAARGRSNRRFRYLQ
jgi:hypothetical protein